MRRWASAIVAHPPDDKPEEFGWTFSNDGKYIIKWFEGPAAPRVLDVTIFFSNEEPMCINHYRNKRKETNGKHLCNYGHVASKINVLLLYCYLAALINH